MEWRREMRSESQVVVKLKSLNNVFQFNFNGKIKSPCELEGVTKYCFNRSGHIRSSNYDFAIGLKLRSQPCHRDRVKV